MVKLMIFLLYLNYFFNYLKKYDSQIILFHSNFNNSLFYKYFAKFSDTNYVNSQSLFLVDYYKDYF